MNRRFIAMVRAGSEARLKEVARSTITASHRSDVNVEMILPKTKILNLRQDVQDACYTGHIKMDGCFLKLKTEQIPTHITDPRSTRQGKAGQGEDNPNGRSCRLFLVRAV